MFTEDVCLKFLRVMCFGVTFKVRKNITWVFKFEKIARYYFTDNDRSISINFKSVSLHIVVRSVYKMNILLKSVLWSMNLLVRSMLWSVSNMNRPVNKMNILLNKSMLWSISNMNILFKSVLWSINEISFLLKSVLYSSKSVSLHIMIRPISVLRSISKSVLFCFQFCFW